MTRPDQDQDREDFNLADLILELAFFLQTLKSTFWSQVLIWHVPLLFKLNLKVQPGPEGNGLRNLTRFFYLLVFSGKTKHWVLAS